MKKMNGVTGALAAMALAACVSMPPPAVRGGPELRLAPERVASARIRNISATTASLYNVDLGPSFGEDIRGALKTCARGEVDLDLNAHVEQPDRDRLIATFELVDPAQGDAAVGRYRVKTAYAAPAIRDGNADDSDLAARMGRNLCEVMKQD